jgi:predicted 3-demethylubiquinone-9 3-methyltransferase (glyoxalase superfamily)
VNKVTPFLWFDDKAEEAALFYTALFEDSEIVETHRHGDAGPGAAGSVMTITFRIGGQTFMALNGGPHYSLTPAMSLFVECRDQAEIDALWDALTAGGQPLRCGWVTDRYGLTWQIVPARLGELLQGEDRARAARVTGAMMEMIKLDIAGLEAA